MNATLQNDTNYQIILGPDSSFFDPGEYVTQPDVPVLEKKSTTYELGPSNMGGGVNGGNAWIVQVDDNTTWDFATGWIAPVRGDHSAGVTESNDPQDGNKAATTTGNTIESTATFKDENGQPFKFVATAVPGNELQASVYTVTAIPIN